jgi:hypothetical protein
MMPAAGRGKGRLWSYIVGERGINRIRVYERRPDGPIWVEWFDRAGRHQRTLTSAAGVPIMDRDAAKRLAEKMAVAQREKREKRALRELLGLREERTLGELLAAYHDSTRAAEWSDGHRRGQESARKFWLRSLGENFRLCDINADRVRKEVREESARKGWSEKSQTRMLHYMKEVLKYAHEQLRWISSDETLSGLKVSKARGESLSYTLEEVARILDAAAQVDLRIAGICWVAALTGRRSGAIRTLHTDAYSSTTVGDRTYGVLQFPAKTDKARRAGRVVLPRSAAVHVERLLEQPRVRSSSCLFPSGDLSKVAPAVPVSEDWVVDTMRRVEAAAGVEQVKRRAVHALKRRWATEAMRIDPYAAERSAGTDLSMLKDTYMQDEDAPKASLADELERLLHSHEA